jgi:hypothetical protein
MPVDTGKYSNDACGQVDFCNRLGTVDMDCVRNMSNRNENFPVRRCWNFCYFVGVTPRNLAFPPGKIIGIDSVFLAKCLLTQPAFRLSGNCFAPKQFFRLVSLGCLPRHNLIPGMLAALIKPPNSFLFNCGVPATLSGLARDVDMNFLDTWDGGWRLGKTCLPDSQFAVTIHGWPREGKFGPNRHDASRLITPEQLADLIAQKYQASKKECQCIVIYACFGARPRPPGPSICSLVAKKLQHCVVCPLGEINTLDPLGISGKFLDEADHPPLWVEFSSSGTPSASSTDLNSLLGINN